MGFNTPKGQPTSKLLKSALEARSLIVSIPRRANLLQNCIQRFTGKGKKSFNTPKGQPTSKRLTEQMNLLRTLFQYPEGPTYFKTFLKGVLFFNLRFQYPEGPTYFKTFEYFLKNGQYDVSIPRRANLLQNLIFLMI